MNAWPVIRRPLLGIMGWVLISGKFLTSKRKIGLVKYLYNGGGKDPQKPSAYRPMTLLPVLGNIYEKIINSWILVHLKVKGKLHERQYGFRPGRCVERSPSRVK